MSNEKRFVLLLVIVCRLDDGDQLSSFPAKSPLRCRRSAAADKGKAEGQAAGRRPGERRGGAITARTTRSRRPKRARTGQERSEGRRRGRPGQGPRSSSSNRRNWCWARSPTSRPEAIGSRSSSNKRVPGIYSVYSSRYDAEPEDNGLGRVARKRPLRLIDHEPDTGPRRWRSR